MRFFNKNFFAGLAVGIVVTIIVEIAAFYILIAIVRSTGYEEKVLTSRLSSPPIPSQMGSSEVEMPEGALSSPGETMADYSWTVQSLKGEDLDFDSLRGKVVFINFWATWCMPCRVEMGSIQQLYDTLKDEDVVFACISNEESQAISKFIKERGFTFPIYTIRGEPPKAFQSHGIPATFIISPAGKIALKHVGAAKWDDPAVAVFITGLKEQNPQ